MIKRLAVFLVFFNCAVSFAQTIKTDVLVIGGSPSGVAAAIQCARSKVKTILVSEGSRLCMQLSGNEMGSAMPSLIWPDGIWGELKKHLLERYPDQDAGDSAHTTLIFQPDTAASIFTKVADTIKNLTMQVETTLGGITRDGDRWDVLLTHDGKMETIKARVVIDATANGNAMTKAGGKYKAENSEHLNYENKLYRTSIFAANYFPGVKGDGYPFSDAGTRYPGYYLPVKAVLAKGVSNLLVTGTQWFEKTQDDSKAYLGLDIALGQAAGVTAAYCAFFKTTTDNLNIRAIQGELLDFKGAMLPLDDIANDKYWRSIQQICATGMLKLVEVHEKDNSSVLFVPDSIVTTSEIKPVMLEIYTRAFIWFNKEKPGAQFTVGNLLSFISELTLTDPDNLQKSISKAWTEQFHFTSTFDLDRPITRREFAILANKYLNPFGRTVDLDGKVVN